MNNNTKDFVKDGLSNEEIINNVKTIIDRSKNEEFKGIPEQEKYEKLKEEFENFSSRYPMLFELAIRNENFSWENLNYMLTMRNKIINDELTSENASKIVGKEWFDKYVDIDAINKQKNPYQNKKRRNI